LGEVRLALPQIVPFIKFGFALADCERDFHLAVLEAGFP
jgi:hypothetical protein